MWTIYHLQVNKRVTLNLMYVPNTNEKVLHTDKHKHFSVELFCVMLLANGFSKTSVTKVI